MAMVEIITVMAPIIASDWSISQASSGATRITPPISNSAACIARSPRVLLATPGCRSMCGWLLLMTTLPLVMIDGGIIIGVYVKLKINTIG